MREDGEEMKIIRMAKRENGITIIELLVALVIFSMVVAGIYRVFVSQSRAYTVQDRVVETQQSIRSSMEILLTDLRITGFDSDHPDSKMSITTPIIPGANQITVDYEFDNTTQYSIRYWRDANSQTLRRQLTTIKDDGSSVAGPEEILLENVEELNFTYGVDKDDGKVLDRYWVGANEINSNNVLAVRVRLTARPQQVTPEDQKMMSPRTLETAVTLRNLCMK
ncbi:MAG: prepilin-type N-terminal cleavage/methylation domain-containing protein [Deltaproteobacteria bacterium]|nr:prepilin-type N-terminal cleavage/methylation domain-containing protein [Deltaproteobacteria bacterium]